MEGLELSNDKIEFTYSQGKRKILTALDIINNSSQKMAYKIKTTYQTRYAVKPNQGIIHTKSSVKINIMIILTDVNDISSIKDKFQVMYMLIPFTKLF